MITFRGKEEERRVSDLAQLLGLDKSEVLRRAVNHYYTLYQEEFKAFEWLDKRLDALPGSGRCDVSIQRKALLEDIYAERAGDRR